MTAPLPQPEHLQVETAHRGDWATVTATGEIDAASAPMLADSLNNVLAAGRYHIVFDLSAVDYFDAAALGVIAAVARRASFYNGRVNVICPRPHQRRLFVLTNLDRAIAVHRYLDTALDTPPMHISETALR